MKTYKAVVIGCSRMGGFIDNEIVGRPERSPPLYHAAVYKSYSRTNLVGCSDLRVDIMEPFGMFYDLPQERQYLDCRELVDTEKPDIISCSHSAGATCENRGLRRRPRRHCDLR